MKNIILAMLTSIPVFASNLNMNTQNIYEKKETAENKGHWIFLTGPIVHRGEVLNPVFGLRLGYQSKLEENSYFQSQRFEIGGISSSLDGLHQVYSLPKFSALHYLNPSSQTRYYYLIGAGAQAYQYCAENKVKSYYDEGSKKTYTYNVKNYESQSSINASIGCGVEFGKASSTINSIELSLEQPILFLGEKVASLEDQTNSHIPFLKLSYVIGF